jgi:hypothetical protein
VALKDIRVIGVTLVLVVLVLDLMRQTHAQVLFRIELVLVLLI